MQGNLKDLSKENYQKLKKQILELGFSSPIHIWKHGDKTKILDGTQRTRTLKTMRDEGYIIPKLPIVYVEASSEHQAKKKVLALTSQFGEITGQGLYEFVTQNDISIPSLDDFRLPEIDLDQWKMEFLEKPFEGMTEEDSVPEAPKEAKTKLGDMYQLGEHRLMCGNSMNKSEVVKLMNGEKADMLCWDPPWRVNFEYNSHQDDQSPEEYELFLRACIDNFNAVSKSDFVAFVWQSEKNWHYFKNWFGIYEARIAVVVKNFTQMAKTFMNRAWDPVFAWHGPDFKAESGQGWRDYFISNTLQSISSGDRDIANQHPCPRSVDVVEYWLQWKQKGNIIDLCGGSGTTLIACEKTNRKCFMMEIDPAYCDVIVARWEGFTGKKAHLL